jgi:hypothetical protein
VCVAAAIEMESNQQILSRYAKSIDNEFISYQPSLTQARNKNRGIFSRYGKDWSCNSSYYEIDFDFDFDLHPALEHNLMLPEGYICAINSDLKS